MVHHLKSEDAAGSVRQTEALGQKALAASADLAGDAFQQLVRAARGPLTLLVNCASLFEDDRIQSVTPAGWDAAMAANLRAPVLLSQAFAAALPADRQGLIVNIIDQRVLRPTPQFFSYAVSKAALWSATQMMAQGLGPHPRPRARPTAVDLPVAGRVRRRNQR